MSDTRIHLLNSSIFQLSGSSAKVLYGSGRRARHVLDPHGPLCAQQIERSKRPLSGAKVDGPNERDAGQAWRELPSCRLVGGGKPEVLADRELCEPSLVPNDQPVPRRGLRGLLLPAVLHLVSRRKLDHLCATAGLPFSHQQHCDRRLSALPVHCEFILSGSDEVFGQKVRLSVSAV